MYLIWRTAMQLLGFKVFMIFMSILVSMAVSCDLSQCSGHRTSAEVSFGEDQTRFCRLLQEYLICLRTLSRGCVRHPHVQQVLNRYTVSCRGSDDVRLSYFQSSNAKKTYKEKVDDKFDDIEERKGNNNKKDKTHDDVFDDIGEKGIKWGTNKNRKDDLYDDVGDDRVSTNKGFPGTNSRQWINGIYDSGRQTAGKSYADRQVTGHVYGSGPNRWGQYGKSPAFLTDDDDDSDSENRGEAFSRNEADFQGPNAFLRKDRNPLFYRNNGAGERDESSEITSLEQNSLVNSDYFKVDEGRHVTSDSDDSGDDIDSFWDHDDITENSKHNSWGGKYLNWNTASHINQLSEYFDDLYDDDDNKVSIGDLHENFYWDDFENDNDFEDDEFLTYKTYKHRANQHFEFDSGADSEEDGYEMRDLLYRNFDDKWDSDSEDTTFSGSAKEFKAELTSFLKSIHNKTIGTNKPDQFKYFDSDFDSENNEDFDSESVRFPFQYDFDDMDSEIDNDDIWTIKGKLNDDYTGKHWKADDYDSDSYENIISFSANEKSEKQPKGQKSKNEITKEEIKKRHNVLPSGLEFVSNDIPLSKRLGIILEGDENKNANLQKSVQMMESVDPRIKRQKLPRSELTVAGGGDWMFKKIYSDTALQSGFVNSCDVLQSSKTVVLLTIISVVIKLLIL